MDFRPAVQPGADRSALAWWFVFVDGGRLLVPDGDDLPLQPFADAPTAAAGAAGALQRPHFLGAIDGLDCWALRVEAPLPGLRAVSLRAAMMRLPAPLAAVAGRAAQVLEWDRAHRHCGVCGTLTELAAHERARRCPGCGHVVYPRISPAMMALVWRSGELLLARSPHYPPGMFSALAGFVEAGESLEDCVVREVAEEVAVQVADLRYFGSQSWPFPHSLMVAYTARWTGGDIVPQPGEIEEAAWFPLDALPQIPPRFSIAGHLIRATTAAMRDGRIHHPTPKGDTP